MRITNLIWNVWIDDVLIEEEYLPLKNGYGYNNMITISIKSPGNSPEVNKSAFRVNTLRDLRKVIDCI